MSKLKRKYTFEDIVAMEYSMPLPPDAARVVSMDGEPAQMSRHIWQAYFFGATHTHVSDASAEDAASRAREAFEAINQDEIDPTTYKTKISVVLEGREYPVDLGEVDENSARKKAKDILVNGIEEQRPSAVIVYPPHVIQQVLYYKSQF